MRRASVERPAAARVERTGAAPPHPCVMGGENGMRMVNPRVRAEQASAPTCSVRAAASAATAPEAFPTGK